MAKFNFNASTITPAPSRSFEPLPAGEYEMMILDSAVKATKAGNGHYIELTMQVVSGTHSGRRLWERLNVDNPNKTAQDIAEQALAKLCLAVDVQDMEDTEELHDIPFIAVVEIDRKEPDRNRITDYQPLLGSAPAKPAAPAGKPAAPKKPWE
jgi:hypothetical protein